MGSEAAGFFAQTSTYSKLNIKGVRQEENVGERNPKLYINNT